MVSAVHGAYASQNALELSRPTSKTTDASRPAASSGTPSIETTSKGSLSGAAKLTAALMTLQKAPSAADYSKPFTQVAQNGRALLDAGYEKLGKKADFETSGKQWQEVVGLNAETDRRTLFAIASNEGGQFSPVERDAARHFMAEQQSAAMFGPLGAANQDFGTMFKDNIDFLDSVSPEEKASLDWMASRGAAQWSYEQRMRDEGRAAENVSTGNPYVELFRSSYDELAATGSVARDPRDMPSYMKALELWRRDHATEQVAFQDFVQRAVGRPLTFDTGV
jgi:hypothetical protein